MKIAQFRRKEFLGAYSSPSEETVPEGAKFLAGAALTLIAPTLLFCAVSGQLLPLYLMATNEALGVAWGVLMFKKSFVGFLTSIPLTRNPKAARDKSATEKKKAA
jgi:hypothetical protein